MPAGPAPTITNVLTCDPGSSTHSGAHAHAGLDERRAGAQPFAVGELDPAVLARAHQAQARARRSAELGAAQRAGLREDRGEHGFAFERGAGAAVEFEGDALARRA